MAGYTYDPSESIKQSFQQATAGIGNIFAQVIQQQQRDYTLAENAFQNIEALKKDLNIFGQKTVTAKSNALLQEAGASILQNGKLDYSKLGEIRQKVSEIKELKQGYDLGSKEYERMLQLGIANKDNMISFEKFYKDLSAKMGDENLVKNPQDLQRALADTYSSNLDSFKIFGKGYLNANPYEKKAVDVRDPKTGALMRVQGELPAGWSIDAQGNKVPPAPKTMVIDGKTVTMDYADQELARLQSTNPDALALMRKQGGFPAQNMSDKDLVKSYVDRIPMTVQSTQVKSQAEIEKEQYGAKAAKFTVENQGRVLEAELESKRAMSDYYRGRGSGTSGNAPQNLADLSINVNEKGKSANFGGDGVKIDIPSGDPKNPRQTVPFKAINVRTLPNGQRQIGGYKLDFEGKVTGELHYVNYDEKDRQIQGSLNSAINRLGKSDKDYIQTQLSVYDRVQIPKRQAAAAAPLLYKGFDLNVLKSANKGVSIEDLKKEIDAQQQQ